MNIPGAFLYTPILGAGESIPMPATYFEDFVVGGSATATGPKFSSTADAAQWLTTLVTSAIPLVEDNANFKAVQPFGAGGVIRIVNAGTNNDSVSMQLNGEPFVIVREKPLYFEVRLATSAIAGTLLFVGLADTDTTLLPAGGQTLGVTDAIGFTIRGTSGLILPIVKGAGTVDSATGETLPTVTGAPALVNNTWSVLRFEVLPTDATNHRVNFYVDGVKVAQHTSQTAALPLGAHATTPIGLTPSYTQKTQGSAANNGFIDYIFCSQMR
jgi:hypothetical protein